MLAEITIGVRRNAALPGDLVDKFQQDINVVRVGRAMNGDTFFMIIAVHITNWLRHVGDQLVLRLSQVDDVRMLGLEFLVGDFFPAVRFEMRSKVRVGWLNAQEGNVVFFTKLS